jgi:hypothetical protein
MSSKWVLHRTDIHRDNQCYPVKLCTDRIHVFPILKSNQVVLLYLQVKFLNLHRLTRIRKSQNQHLQCSVE